VETAIDCNPKAQVEIATLHATIKALRLRMRVRMGVAVGILALVFCYGNYLPIWFLVLNFVIPAADAILTERHVKIVALLISRK
jgi:hypothetical protein